MNKNFLIPVVTAMVVFAGSADAQVANSTLFNAKLGFDTFDFVNNVDLDSNSGLTDPLFNLTVGGSLFFGVSLVGTRLDQVRVTFAGILVVLSQPNVDGAITYVPTTGGGANYTTLVTFNTAGTFSGTIQVNALLSTPDYSFNGGAPITEAPTFTYRVAVTAVPEPANWALMTLGLGFVGGAIRLRTARKIATGA